MTSHMYRPGEVFIIPIASTVPAANDTVDVELGPGAFRLSLLVNSNATGTTTSLGITVHIDDDTPGDDQLYTNLYGSTSGSNGPRTLPAGAAVASYMFISTGSNFGDMSTPIRNKIRVHITKGGATTGETLEVTLLAIRV